MKSERFETQTFYEILEVPHTAAPQEIHAAYQRAKATYSTESPALYTMFTPDEARELLAVIEEAFDTLSNHQRRQLYDQKIAHRQLKTVEPPKQRIAPVPKELPDFHIEETGADPHTVAKQKVPTTAPAGYAKTKFGLYPVDQKFEDEIQQATLFDGEFLKRIRSYKKISLDQMCDETRINKPYMVAVEANDFKSLPAPVFVRGFIIQIARILGLNEKKASDSYMQILKKQMS
jgi:curved DNA-binding protein CbpA